MELNAILARKPGLVTADMEGETVMMDMDSGRYYNLGKVGGRIWEMLESPRSLAQLVAALTEAYDVDAAQCRRDVAPFLDDMLARGLLVVEAAS